MEAKQKRSLRRRLLVIYILYFLALAAGFVLTLVPDICTGWAAGNRAGIEDIQMLKNHGIHQQTYFVGTELASDMRHFTPIETIHPDITVEAAYTGAKFFVTASDQSDPACLSQLGRMNYTLLFFIPALLAKLALLVLVALTINVLRKSVRDEQPLPNKIITYTRAVGFLLIFAEICLAIGAYLHNRTAQIVLEGSSLEVETSFQLDYWNLVMAILVLFSAEVFSIGTRMSEEQKFTI